MDSEDTLHLKAIRNRCKQAEFPVAFLSGFYHVHLAFVGGSRAVLSGTGYFGKVPKPGFRIGFTGMTGQAKLFLLF